VTSARAIVQPLECPALHWGRREPFLTLARFGTGPFPRPENHSGLFLIFRLVPLVESDLASHFVSLVRGQDGTKYNDYVTGTSSSGAVGLELRLDDSAVRVRFEVHVTEAEGQRVSAMVLRTSARWRFHAMCTRMRKKAKN
jgi:hypothetical protein